MLNSNKHFTVDMSTQKLLYIFDHATLLTSIELGLKRMDIKQSKWSRYETSVMTFSIGDSRDVSVLASLALGLKAKDQLIVANDQCCT